MDSRQQKPVVVVTGRGRPHEVVLLALSVLVGAAYTFGATQPGSVSSLQPAWLAHVWSAGLLASGLVGLWAVWWFRRNPDRALRLEVGAMLIGAGSLIVSSTAVFVLAADTGSVWRALLSGGFGVAWAVANLWRAWQCRVEAAQLRQSGAGSD